LDLGRAQRALDHLESANSGAQTIGTESFVVATEIGAEPLDFGLDIAATSISSGCIRMINQDVIDLYQRTPVGNKVVVLAARAG
jgi:predicted transcriptional regulator